MTYTDIATAIIHAADRCPHCIAAANSRDDAQHFVTGWQAMRRGMGTQPVRPAPPPAAPRHDTEWYAEHIPAWLAEHGPASMIEIARAMGMGECGMRKQITKLCQAKVLVWHEGNDRGKRLYRPGPCATL